MVVDNKEKVKADERKRGETFFISPSKPLERQRWGKVNLMRKAIAKII